MRNTWRTLLCSALAAAMIIMTACTAAPASTQTASTTSAATPTPPSPTETPATTPPPASQEPTATTDDNTGDPPQSDRPFTYDDDIAPLIEEGSTIGDVIGLIGAQTVEWDYEGEATGVSHLIFRSGENYIVLSCSAPEGSVLDDFSDDAHPISVLPPEVLEEEASITGMRWLDNGFVVPFIRGVGLGAAEEDVLRAFLCLDPTGEVIYGIDALNPLADESWANDFVGAHRLDGDESDPSINVIEYVWADVENEGEWLEYYYLAYEIKDAKVTSIQLYYGTDPE